MTQTKPKIQVALPPLPHLRALIDGRVNVEGYDLEFTHAEISHGERHYRFSRGEFDVGEFSTATFLRTKEKGFGFRALPVFFERGPRQRNIFYCEGKLSHPGDLKGRKVGCFRYGATAVSWARGFLLDAYGLRTTDMGWYVSGQEVYIGQELPVKVERPDRPAPFGQEKVSLSRLLSEGVLHAAIVPGDSGYPSIFGGGTLPAEMSMFSGVKPLFGDADEIIGYVRKTRIYPIIHLIAMKEEIVSAHPDLPRKLLEAFRESRKLGEEYMTAEQKSGFARERDVVGEDPYAYALGESEKRTLRALNRYQIEQGLMRSELALEGLFVREAFA